MEDSCGLNRGRNEINFPSLDVKPDEYRSYEKLSEVTGLQAYRVVYWYDNYFSTFYLIHDLIVLVFFPPVYT